LFLTYSFIPGSAESTINCSVTSFTVGSAARADENPAKAVEAKTITAAVLCMVHI
jgi:hypothetical protein